MDASHDTSAPSVDGEPRTSVGDADDVAVARRPGTTHPRLARERALKVLFQADVRGEDPRVVLDRIETTRGALVLLDELEPDQDQVDAEPDLQLELTRRARLPLDDYTRQLVGGVASRRSAIDRLLGDVSDNWAVARMPVVDRNLLRLAIHEMVVEDTPHPVVIDEAVALARAFAGDKAVSFVNGVLETVRQAVARGDVELGVSVDLPDPDAAPPAGASSADASSVGASTVGASAADGGEAAEAGGAGPDAAGDAGGPGAEGAAGTPQPDAHGAAAWNDALDLLGLAPEPAPEPDPASESAPEPAPGSAPESASESAGGDVLDGDVLDDEDDLDPETEVAILLGELGPDGEPLAEAEGSDADAFDDAFDDEADDRFDGIDDLADAEQDALFGDDLDDQD